MNVFLALLILTVGGSPRNEAAEADASTIYTCGFEEEVDRNYDNWPDGWTRRRGPGYPDYLKISLATEEEEDPATTGRFLRIELDGGAATVYSSPIPTSDLFGYTLSGRVRTRALRYSAASFSLTFLNAEKRPLGTHYSRLWQDASSWQEGAVGPVTPPEGTAFGVIGLHLRPTDKGDLIGSAEFDELRLARLPRFSLELNAEHHLYFDPRNIEVTCRASGLMKQEPELEFELQDVYGQTLEKASQPLRPDRRAANVAAADDSVSGTAVWRPAVSARGFYRVSVRLANGGQTTIARSTSFVFLAPARTASGGPFGVAFPRGEERQTTKALAWMAYQSGANWVKFPLWHQEGDLARADELALFAERLGSRGIELVGVLDQPPRELRERFGTRDQLPIASVFIEPAVWQPVLEPVMSRLALKVRWWQIGADRDLSFVGYPLLERRIGEIRKHFGRYGQEIRLVLPWDAAHEPPNSKAAPWAGFSYLAEPEFTAAEQTEFFAAGRESGGVRWLVLRPLPRSTYAIETRISDLMARMVAAKTNRSDAVFIPDVFDDEHGLYRADGSPGELFLPWRTTCQMIADAEHLGSIELPGGSRNEVFAKGAEAVLVVWNDTPTQESLYLGAEARQIDCWGREKRPRATAHEQQIDVGPVPVFVTGANLAVAKVRLSLRFEQKELESVFGRDQAAVVRFGNHFGRGIGGEVSLAAPKGWEISPSKAFLKAAAGEEATQRFLVQLKTDADTGDQPVRLDFDVAADRHYKFSVYRTLRVGRGDVLLALSTRLTENGDLLVEQRLENTTDQRLSFNCYLFAPDRKRQRAQIFEQGRGRITQTYLLSDGNSLLGETLWLRAEEINGSRILNCRVTAEP